MPHAPRSSVRSPRFPRNTVIFPRAAVHTPNPALAAQHSFFWGLRTPHARKSIGLTQVARQSVRAKPERAAANKGNHTTSPANRSCRPHGEEDAQRARKYSGAYKRPSGLPPKALGVSPTKTWVSKRANPCSVTHAPNACSATLLVYQFNSQ